MTRATTDATTIVVHTSHARCAFPAAFGAATELAGRAPSAVMLALDVPGCDRAPHHPIRRIAAVSLTPETRPFGVMFACSDAETIAADARRDRPTHARAAAPAQGRRAAVARRVEGAAFQVSDRVHGARGRAPARLGRVVLRPGRRLSERLFGGPYPGHVSRASVVLGRCRRRSRLDRRIPRRSRCRAGRCRRGP